MEVTVGPRQLAGRRHFAARRVLRCGLQATATEFNDLQYLLRKALEELKCTEEPHEASEVTSSFTQKKANR